MGTTPNPQFLDIFKISSVCFIGAVLESNQKEGCYPHNISANVVLMGIFYHAGHLRSLQDSQLGKLLETFSEPE